MEKIPFAEEILDNAFLGGDGKDITEGVIEAMIEFAKLHVEAAKKEYHKVLVKQGRVTEAGIAYFDNAYSIDNIK